MTFSRQISENKERAYANKCNKMRSYNNKFTSNSRGEFCIRIFPLTSQRSSLYPGHNKFASVDAGIEFPIA